MGESKFSLSVQPGVLAAILFIGLDIITLGILDIVLSRVVCLVYYRKINRGRPVSVKSADIPGLTNYLLGKFFSLTNLAALGVKLSLLAVVFVVNLRIDSDSAFAKVPVQRTSVFRFVPSDEEFKRAKIRTVRRRPESSKSCVKEGEPEGDDEGEGDKLTYYQLAFNLRDGEELDDDIGGEGDTPGKYDIEDASIICMSPANVHNAEPIATVLGCTRKPESGCLTVISMDESIRKDVTAEEISDEEWTLDGGEPTHNLTVYDPDEVKNMFSEYDDPVLTCLSTSVGITEFGGVSRYRHCLMVAHNESVTFVERWIVQRKDNSSNEDELVLEYPGVIFEGDVKIEQRIAAKYLQVLFPFTTYRSLSGQLIADGAKFEGKRQTVVRNGEKKTVTTIPVWAVFLVVAAVVLVVTGRVVTYIVLRKDKRPKFNTIDGLSSIVREECVPTGRSYDAGDSAVLGLRYTTDDLLHFGPLSEVAEGARYDAAQDIS